MNAMVRPALTEGSLANLVRLQEIIDSTNDGPTHRQARADFLAMRHQAQTDFAACASVLFGGLQKAGPFVTRFNGRRYLVVYWRSPANSSFCRDTFFNEVQEVPTGREALSSQARPIDPPITEAMLSNLVRIDRACAAAVDSTAYQRARIEFDGCALVLFGELKEAGPFVIQFNGRRYVVAYHRNDGNFYIDTWIEPISELPAGQEVLS